MPEATSLIGKVIGKPDLQYRQITYDQFHGILLQMGASQSIADLFVEMSEALNQGMFAHWGRDRNGTQRRLPTSRSFARSLCRLIKPLQAGAARA